MTWLYTARPQHELRWYPSGTRTYAGVPLLREFDALDPYDIGAVTEKLRRTGGHDITGDVVPVRDSSGDSYQAFLRGYRSTSHPWEPEHLYQARLTQQRRDRRAAVISAEQQSWEQARLERLRLQRAASDAEWAAAERKVQRAAAALQQAEHAEQAARLAAAMLEAERQRQRQQRQVQTFHARERQQWIGCLRAAIDECQGNFYAGLIPQLLADIATIESQPPGALPWRFDAARFAREFTARKAAAALLGR